MYKLVGTDGERFYSWELNPGSYTIGRGDDCDFCILNNTVSRNHALLTVGAGPGNIVIEDKKSHNGTYINGSRIDSTHDLDAGDIILFGKAEFKITESSSTSQSSTRAHMALAGVEPENSIFMPLDEAMRPLPPKMTDIPDLVPTIFEMAKILDMTDPQETMLERSLELISRIIPSERLMILTTSDDDDEVSILKSRTASSESGVGLKLSKTIINEIMENKSSILIANPEDDSRFATQKSIIAMEMKSAMAVPLFDEGEVLGILYADTTNPGHKYNDDYLRVMATCGNIIASRMINYELLQEREIKHLMDAEIRRASSIQKNLLVKDPPALDGYSMHAYQEQSRQVGGDLYDWRILPDGCLAFMVGDVSGKGMGAALLMSNILASFRILYDEKDFDPKDAVKRVSLQLYNYSVSSNFATMFLAVLDPKSNTLSYVNAGHNPPLLITGNGEKTLLESTGMMIGVFDFADWDMKSVKMEPGDLLFIFSDGVTEADRGNGDQFGDERTEEFILSKRNKSPREISSDLIGEINDFMGDAPRSDDITIMTVKREKK